MQELVRRWQRAGMRASEEAVRVVRVGDEYYASSSSKQLGSYHLTCTSEGWTCECIGNAKYGLPCKHLAALATALDLDVLAEIRAGLPVEHVSGLDAA